MDGNHDLIALVSRLVPLAYARHRETEREVRTITITDDEALLLLDALRDAGAHASEGW